MGGRQYSYQTGERNSFHWLDYVIFGFTLLFSASIGVFYAIKDRRKKSVKDFLLAGGNMPVVPVAMSLLASFMSAITLLGTPSETYNFTTIYIWMGLGQCIAIVIAAYVYTPVFYNLGLTSIYEYLELRFSKGVRVIGTLIFSTQMLVYMAIVLYGPALAISAVTGLSLWGAVAGAGIVCIFYTSLGGMKAVLWTDTFQICMMMAGVIAALIQGCIEIGGFHKAWAIAEDNHRVYFTDLDPTVRHSVFGLVIGGTLLWLSVYGTNQSQVQRSLTCSSLKDAQRALWINGPGLLVILLLSCMVGIVMYAFYSTCDPISFNLIVASDQLFPLFVMDVLGHVPGVPGLFVASIFSGALSTLSSGLNSLAAVIFQDILKPYCLSGIQESRATTITKILSVVFGLLCLGLTWVASQLGGIMQASLSLFGILGAPMLSLFTLGMMVPWANKWGAYSGLLTSLVVLFWITTGAYLNKLPPKRSPVSTEGCNWNLTMTSLPHDVAALPYDVTVTHLNLSYDHTTVSFPDNFTQIIDNHEWFPLQSLYSISYLWYSLIALLVVHAVALPVSFITGPQKLSKVNPKLISPLFDAICSCLPVKWRGKCRYGYDYQKDTDEETRRQKAKEGFSDQEITSFIEREVDISPPVYDDRDYANCPA